MEKSLLYFRKENDVLFIRFEGRVTSFDCSALRNLILPLIQSEEIGNINVDLSSCEYMDSTIMGFLVILNKKLKQTNDHLLNLLNPSESSTNLLSELGVFDLMEHRSVSFPALEKMEILRNQAAPAQEMLLKTHEALMDLSIDNEEKFKALHNILKTQKDSNAS